MRQYLGPRGTLMAAAVTLFSVAAAAYAGWKADPLGAAVCLLLGYIALLLTVLWGLVKTKSRSILQASKLTREAIKPFAADSSRRTTNGAGPDNSEPAQSLRAMVELLIRDKVALRADEERLALQISELTERLSRLDARISDGPGVGSPGVGAATSSTPARP